MNKLKINNGKVIFDIFVVLCQNGLLGSVCCVSSERDGELQNATRAKVGQPNWVNVKFYWRETGEMSNLRHKKRA